jgi:hypothetical protein
MFQSPPTSYSSTNQLSIGKPVTTHACGVCSKTMTLSKGMGGFLGDHGCKRCGGDFMGYK